MKLAIWNDHDIVKALAIGAVSGFVVGLAVGYEWAWKPVVNVFKPLIG